MLRPGEDGTKRPYTLQTSLNRLVSFYPKIRYIAVFTLWSRKLRTPDGMNAAMIEIKPAIIPRILYFITTSVTAS